MAEPEEEELLHEEYASKLPPWLMAGVCVVAVFAGDECPGVTWIWLLLLLINALRSCRGEECGLCFSVRDKVLLRACRDEVAMLKSPRSCNGRERRRGRGGFNYAIRLP